MTSVYRGITVPDLTDPPNAPAQLRAMVDTGGAVPRFATLGDANTAYPAGSRPAGMMVAIGTRLYISDGTNFVSVSAGGVEIFATKAARDAALPSPAVGQMCAVGDWPYSPLTFSRWPPLGTNRWVGSLATTVDTTTNGNGEVIVNFPTAFSATPSMSGFMDLNSSGDWIVIYGLKLGYPNANGFQLAARDATGTGTQRRNGGRVYFSYVATGPV
jgi:hypothetical protein